MMSGELDQIDQEDSFFFSIAQTVLQFLVFASRIPVAPAITARHHTIPTHMVLQKGMLRSTFSVVTSCCKEPDEVNRSSPQARLGLC